MFTSQNYNKKGYVHLFKSITVFLILVAAADLIIGYVYHYFYFKQTSGWEYRTKYSIENTKADILIFGASRAQQQYNPVYFEQRLNQTCYNVGRDGEPFFYHYGILKGVLNRYTPKIIILDIENAVFRQNESSYDRISVLLPFYQHHKEMRPIIELRSPYEKFKLLSSIYPYNSLLFKIAAGNLKHYKGQEEDIKGYLQLTNALDEPIRKVNLPEDYILDSNLVNYFRLFIKECLQRKIKLYLVCSPYFIDAIGRDPSMTLAKGVAEENNIDFFDFSRDNAFLTNSKLFDDTVHVNVSGSQIFTNKLIDSIILKTHSPIN